MKTCNIAFLIMAAGEGRRFGGHKKLADLAGQSLLARQLKLFEDLNIVNYSLFLGLMRRK